MTESINTSLHNTTNGKNPYQILQQIQEEQAQRAAAQLETENNVFRRQSLRANEVLPYLETIADVLCHSGPSKIVKRPKGFYTPIFIIKELIGK